MNPTVAYWLLVVGLCVLFPPLFGFVITVEFFCLVSWLWFKAIGG